jgi:hypothetical protein
MLRPLALAGLRVVLLPCKACLFPALVHSVDKVPAELGVELLCTRLMGSLLLSKVLWSLLARCSTCQVEYKMTYEKLGHCEVVDRHPDWSTPVVLGSVIELVVLAQTPQTVRAP